MKEEIKKKIEDTAANEYPSELETNEYYAFQEGAEYGYSLAQQSVNSDLELSIRTKLHYLESVSEFSVSTDSVRCWIDLYKDECLSSSQNQQNEKSAPSQVVEEAMRVTQKHVRVPNAIINGEVLSPQQNEKESDAVCFMNWCFSDECRQALSHQGKPDGYDYRAEELYEIFKQLKQKKKKHSFYWYGFSRNDGMSA